MTENNNGNDPESTNGNFLVLETPWDHGIYLSRDTSKIVCFNDEAARKAAPGIISINGVPHYDGGQPQIAHCPSAERLSEVVSSSMREYHRAPK